MLLPPPDARVDRLDARAGTAARADFSSCATAFMRIFLIRHGVAHINIDTPYIYFWLSVKTTPTLKRRRGVRRPTPAFISTPFLRQRAKLLHSLSFLSAAGYHFRRSRRLVTWTSAFSKRFIRASFLALTRHYAATFIFEHVTPDGAVTMPTASSACRRLVVGRRRARWSRA